MSQSPKVGFSDQDEKSIMSFNVVKRKKLQGLLIGSYILFLLTFFIFLLFFKEDLEQQEITFKIRSNQEYLSIDTPEAVECS